MVSNLKTVFLNNKIKIVISIVLLLIGFVIIFNSSKESTFSEYTKILNSLVLDDGKAYFTFVNDPITYIAYENNGVDFNLLNSLSKGDSLNLLLKDGGGGSKYTIIYILEHNNSVLFDVTNFYKNNDLIVSIIFPSIFLFASALLLGLSFANVIKKDSFQSFKVYCEAKWTHTFFVVFMLLGILFSVEFVTFYFVGLIPLSNLGFSLIGLIFAFIGGLGVLVYRNCYISYKNGTYSFKTIGTKLVLNSNSFSKIVVKFYVPQKAYFLNNESKIVGKISFSYGYLDNPVFLESIKSHDIQLSISPLFKNYRGKNKVLEDKTIEAIDLFDNERYEMSFVEFSKLLKEDDDVFNALYTMLSAVYVKEFEIGKDIYDKLDTYYKKNYGLLNKLFSRCRVEYLYTLALAKMNKTEDAVYHLNNLISLRTNHPNEVSKEEMLELLNAISISEKEMERFRNQI